MKKWIVTNVMVYNVVYARVRQLHQKRMSLADSNLVYRKKSIR